MSKAIKLFVITLLILFFVSNVKAQNPTISLNLLQTGTMDIAAFAMGSELANQPRIMEVTIFPEGIDVKVRINIKWKKSGATDYIEFGTFTTNVFKSRSFSNQDLGNSEIRIPSNSSDYNSDLLEENIAIGKPSGLYSVTVHLLDVNDQVLDSDFGLLEYLNPTEPTILLPVEGSSYDVGSIIISWTPSIGASGYRIQANYLSNNQGREEALNASDPLVNNKDVANSVSVNLRDVIDRELLPDTSIVIAVKAIVSSSGGDQLLSSPIVMFKTNPAGGTTGPTIQVDPKIIQLADLLQGKVQQQFISDLRSGVITSDQIQVTDNDNPMTLDSLLELLNMLNANSESLISIQFTAQ